METREQCKRGHLRTSKNRDSEGRCKDCKLERGDVWRKEHPESILASARKHKYGASKEQVKTMWAEQQGKCAVCGVDLLPLGRKTNSACLDHVHDTSKRLRGLLCKACNQALGLFKDNICSLEKAIEYLKKFLPTRPASA